MTARSPIGWVILGGLGMLAPSRPAVAQLGHDPAHSPYRDVLRGPMVRVTTGYFSGTRGKIPVGPSDGPTGGLRFEYPMSNLLVFSSGIAYAQTDAFFFDPNDSLPQPRGPINNDLLLFDLGIQASLTGAKTFHGLQPYVGASLGLVFGSAIGGDSSGYNFGTKFSYAPELGIRWYPTRRLTVELGSRFVFYKLQYPFSYRPKLLPVNAPLTQMTVHPWAMFGIGWTF